MEIDALSAHLTRNGFTKVSLVDKRYFADIS